MDATTQHGWFFTAPWDPVYVRRGDALGLRGLNDLLGDLVAPGLTNRTHDARWVTILAWCLARSHEVWMASGGDLIRGRDDAALRYAWLRPLELMWVARTLRLVPDDARGRQLHGQRRVRAWLRYQPRPPRFAMSDDQYQGYRQTGMYGAYRTLLRSLPAMTRSRDGWTPDSSCHLLAKETDKLLAKARFTPDAERERKIRRDWQGREDEWWLDKWQGFDAGSEKSLPHKRSVVVELEEASSLQSLLFGADAAGVRRARVASMLSGSRARDHQALCEELADALKGEPDGARIAMIPTFAVLADAGVETMDAVSEELAHNREGPGLSLSGLARRPAIQAACTSLGDAARRWLASERVEVRHVESADRLAHAVASGTTKDRLEALLHHHTAHGGGVRWFVVKDGVVEPKLRPSERGSSRYRFRLWPLARMAVQAGETSTVPAALIDDETYMDDEEAA